jgi:hypothetical protein
VFVLMVSVLLLAPAGFIVTAPSAGAACSAVEAPPGFPQATHGCCDTGISPEQPDPACRPGRDYSWVGGLLAVAVLLLVSCAVVFAVAQVFRSRKEVPT